MTGPENYNSMYGNAPGWFVLRLKVSDVNGLQTSGLVKDPPLHVHPGSMWHVELQPSPLTVFPSSQGRIPEFIPSPQTSIHWPSGSVKQPFLLLHVMQI